MKIEDLKTAARTGDGLIMYVDEHMRVREYAEGYEVRIGYQPETPEREDSSTRRDLPDPNAAPRFTLLALNEGRHNGTRIDLLDVLLWVSQICPELNPYAIDRAAFDRALTATARRSEMFLRELLSLGVPPETIETAARNVESKLATEGSARADGE